MDRGTSIICDFAFFAAMSTQTSKPEPDPKGPSTQTVGFQGPKTIQSMDFGT